LSTIFLIFLKEALAKVVIPVKTGIQRFCNTLKRLDSHFRGNNKLFSFRTFARASKDILKKVGFKTQVI